MILVLLSELLAEMVMFRASDHADDAPRLSVAIALIWYVPAAVHL
jgi:hypothetical protein